MNFRHLTLLLVSMLILGFVSNSNAQNSRTPQNYVPETDLFAGYQDDSFSEDIWKNDHAGALRNLKQAIGEWQENEEYILNYDLTNFDSGSLLTIEQKRRLVEKGLLRYLDKRIMHKVKNAPRKSSLAKVNTARKALRPSSTAAISKNFKLKFRAKLLRGRGSLLFINPWIDASAQFSLSGKMEFNLRREFKSPGLLTEVKVNLHNDQWIALMQKSISESIKAQILSIQPIKSVAQDDADRRIQLLYNKNF